jgi:hypothetical protein
VTAEIAIINRSAVALATDSAVTLQVRGMDKVYNSADKLFELSNKDPFGIMIYNNLEFMGLSLEVLIKQFRDQKGNVHYQSAEDIASEFFSFIAGQCFGETELQKLHAVALLDEIIDELSNNWRQQVDYEIIQKGRDTDYPGLLTKNITSMVHQYTLYADAAGFSDSEFKKKILSEYSETFSIVRDKYFGRLPLSDEHKSDIDKLCLLALIKDKHSQFFTGMVFAGFGKEEQFPSLISYEIDGIISDRLKIRKTEEVKTDRTKITGEVLPFAQREMVDRFLYGIDPNFENGIEEFLDVSINSACLSVINAASIRSRKKRNSLQAASEAAAQSALRQWRDTMVPTIKNKFKEEVQDMIFLMPKQELATLAQELINLTSVKRKFSNGKETVGGPIDVAVISRIDGFVWVQRKHYFRAELNPRYFSRKFGTMDDKKLRKGEGHETI